MDPSEKAIEDEWESSYKEADLSKLPWESLKPPSRLVKLVDLGKIRLGRAIDIGCGLGTNAIYLAQKGFDVVGLDISESALEYASKRAAESGVRIKFVHGFAHNLDFPDRHFTLVFDRGCFHHIPPEFRQQYIKEVHRVLADNGSYYLECFCNKCGKDYGYRFSKEDLEMLFIWGFKIVIIEELKNKGPEGEVMLYSVFMEKK